MGGWIISESTPERFHEQVERFRRVFSVDGVPPLHVETRSFAASWHLLLWAWSAAPAPDVCVAVSGDAALVLDGAVTGSGWPGALDEEAVRTAGRSEAVDTGSSSTAGRVLDAWRTEGPKSIRTLDGSFGGAVVAPTAGRVTLYTDRFASRSVWFGRDETGWLAANYPAALAAIGSSAPRLDPAGLWSLFATSRHVGPRGLYAGLHNLQAGQFVVLHTGDARGADVRRWHESRYRPEHGRPVSAWAAEMADTVKGAARRLARVTPAPYLFLSGGLDSRIAAGALGERARTVTLTSSSANLNARMSQRVARQVGARHLTIHRAPTWYIDAFEAAALAAGGNYNIQHAHFSAPIRQIREAEPDAAFLIGDLLENFNKHYVKTAPDEAAFMPEAVPDMYPRLYSYVHPDPARLLRLFRPALRERLVESWRAAVVGLCREVREVSENDRDCFDALFRWHNCSLCPTFLMIESIRPMAAERNLMFDNAMLDLLRRIPAAVRGAHVLHPRTLWQLDRRLAVIPDSNTWLPPLTPKPVQRMAKRIRPAIGRARRRLSGLYQDDASVRTEGSWHMLHTRYREDDRHRAFVEDCLLDEACLPTDIFDEKQVAATWGAFLTDPSDRALAYEVDMLLAFGLLHRRIPSAGIG